jgi:iron complex outermembrane recepter protein
VVDLANEQHRHWAAPSAQRNFIKKLWENPYMSSSSNKALPSVIVLAAVAAAIAAPAVRAQQVAQEASSEASLQEVIVTGTRQSGLEAADSPAPIQILSSEALEQVASSPDLMATLAQVVPSLTMQAFGFDMAGQTLLAKLRGMSPNHVLVLIDGKRRHTTANLAIDQPSAYQGGAGVDLNFIPVDAIDHIEVLTEGAAAQYGTDAIAGVINIILKKKSSGATLNGTYGAYFNGGGNTGDVSGNVGLEPYDGAYFNVTAEVRNHGHSNQSAIDERVINPAILATYPNSNMPQVAGYPYLNMISGDGEQHLKLVTVNSGFKLGEAAEFYAFATYGDKHAASYENYRLPSKVSFTDATTGVTTYPFPFGFNPMEAAAETDWSFTGGFKGNIADWNWDVSSTYGADKVIIHTDDSANAALYAGGPLSLQNFYDGLLQATQWTTTVDLNRDFDVGMAGPLNVAFGAESRRETYTIGAGIPSSYTNGGAQSYPGFTPTDAGVNDRKNYAGYLDFAGKPVDQLRLDLAGRYEHYSDFGNATVGKLTARWDFTPQFALRGTVSNGFRAPTLAEEFYSSTNVGPTTAIVQLPPNSPGGKLLGLGDGLQPEKSVNYSVGFVFRPIERMNMTLDLYQITVTNRIVGSGQLDGANHGVVLSPIINEAIAANGNQLDPGVVATGTTGVTFFTNGIDTRTRGGDFTFNFPVDYDLGHVNYSIGATYNETVITAIRATPPQLGTTPLFDATAMSELTTASPKYVINLGATWSAGNASVNLVEHIYGPSSDYELDDGDNPTNNNEYFKTTIGVTPITDLNLAYHFTKYLKISVGASNLFNRFPNKLNSTLLAHADNFTYQDNLGVTQYPGFSPFGINGGFYFAKATLSF